MFDELLDGDYDEDFDEDYQMNICDQYDFKNFNLGCNLMENYFY